MLDLVLGLHLLTAHAAPGYETATPGVYAMAPSGLTVGAYRNSYGRPTAYAGWTWSEGRYHVTLIGATGYRRAPVVPLLAGGIKVGQVRFSVLPGRVSALNVSIEERW